MRHASQSFAQVGRLGGARNRFPGLLLSKAAGRGAREAPGSAPSSRPILGSDHSDPDWPPAPPSVGFRPSRREGRRKDPHPQLRPRRRGNVALLGDGTDGGGARSRAFEPAGGGARRRGRAAPPRPPPPRPPAPGAAAPPS